MESHATVSRGPGTPAVFFCIAIEIQVDEGTTNQDHFNRVFSALADRTRRDTLTHLAKGPATVGELAEPHNLSAAAFSKHLRVLREAGLIEKELDGRQHRCSLTPRGLKAALKWLAVHEQFWSGGLDGLEQFLQTEKPKSKGKRKP